jgi:hypothetical protein
MRHVDPGKQKQSRVVGDIAQAALPGGRVPTDKFVTRAALPGGGPKQGASHRSALALAHQIAQVFPDGTAVTQVMVMMEQRVEERPFVAARGRAHLAQGQGQERAQFPNDRSRIGQQSRGQHTLAAHPVVGNLSAGGQSNPASGFQFEQKRARGHVFELSGRVAPVPQLGQRLADPMTAPLRVIGQKGAHLRQFRRADEAALNDARFNHAPQYGAKRNGSPAKNENIFTPTYGESFDESWTTHPNARSTQKRPEQLLANKAIPALAAAVFVFSQAIS